MPFTCGLCLEDHRTSRSTCVLLPNGDEVCTFCFRESIVEQFWNSIRNPSAFPFHWGDTPLHFQDYAQYIPGYQAMLRAYNAKRIELETRPEKRVYCDRDGSFLGVRCEVPMMTGKHECDLWGRIVCASCTKHATDNHVCRRDSRKDAFEGLERGKDWQGCPSCSAPFFLGDGCNAVKCANCREQFCFLCAKAVKHGDKQHWQPGMDCPRFGRPWAANALYDDQVRVFDDDPRDDQDMEAVDGAEAFLQWGALFRARVEPARQQLREVKEVLLMMRLREPGFDASLEHIIELTQELICNYGFFMVGDDGHLDLQEIVAKGDRATADRHRDILEFEEFPAAAWALGHFPALRRLRRWYLNHIQIRREEQVVGQRLVRVRLLTDYGNPEQDALFDM